MRKLIFGILLIGLIGVVHSAYSQDDCNTVVDIPVENYSTCGDMAMESIDLATATPSSTAPAPPCGNFSGTTNDLWYSYTVPAGVTEMSFHMFNSNNLIPFPNSSAPAMAIYRGNCAALVLLDCFEGTGGFMSNTEIRWENVTGLVPGETIFIRAWDENNLAQEIFIAASVINNLPEADCANPPELGTGGCNILAPAGTIQAPEDCGWNSTDNVVFYSFEVLPTDPQPVVLEIEYGQCWANEGTGPIPIPATIEIQYAVYSWDGTSCNGVGGSPLSDPPNNSGTYYGCENGTGTVVYSNNLPPGQYLLAMDGFSDTGGNSLCTFGVSASFLDPDPDRDPDDELSVTLTTIDTGCGQAGSASITINSSCSTNPTVEWSTTQTGNNITNLTAGAYSVTVTDDAPCGDTIINFTITDNSNFAISLINIGDPCSSPITLNANVMGANPADVDFLWDNPAASTTQSISVNTSGTYSCTATYGTCSDTDDITINIGEFDFNVVYTPTVCAGATGSATFNAIIGSGDYMYEWSTGEITPGITIPGAGNYCLTATDNLTACQDVFCFTVEEVPAVNVTIDYEDISCHDKVDGWATAVASGGTLPYDYMWSTFMPTETITQLLSGNYSVTVTDSAGCTGTASVFIENPPEFYYSITPNQGICFGEQVDINVVATGGVQPYHYDWSDSPDMNTDSRTLSPPQTTIYTVTVLDANGCTYTPQSSKITVSQPINIDVTTVDVLCHGECTGTATLDITGGIPPFTYTWASTTDFMQNLCVGDYGVTITDMYDCVGDIEFEITEPDTIYLTTFSGNATCFGYSDGFVEVDVVGGVPFSDISGDFYNYQWSNGSTADSLATYAGMHFVTVTDANGCSHVASAFVDQPEAIYVTNAWGGTICIGEPFSTSVNATGGHGPYDFVWTGSDGSTWYGNSLNVSPDITTTYQLVTTDTEGCFGPPQNITVNVNPVITIQNTSSSPADVCIGETVMVEMEIAGGNGGPYTISRLDHGIVNMPYTFYPNETGYYVFEVRDDCGSPTDKDSIYVTVHPKPQVAFFADKTASCPPGLFTFTETTPEQGQTYLWDFGDGGFSVQKHPTHTYSQTGTYDVSLTAWSEWGCKRVRTYENMINIYPEPRADFAGNPEIVSVFNPMVEFTNYTEGGHLYFWDFGDGNSTLWTDEPQIHFYKNIGEYEIMMIAKNQYECRDTAFKHIRVHDEFTFYAPEAFTPNGDGLNDVFYVTGHGIDKTQFYFVIYDRFGVKVFETDIFDEVNPTRMAWDGTHNGSAVKGDPILPNGMYRWYCAFVDFNGKPREESGTVTLIR